MDIYDRIVQALRAMNAYWKILSMHRMHHYVAEK